MLRPALSVCMAAALAGCNDHRYGFFGNEEGSGGETTGGLDPTRGPTSETEGRPDPTAPNPTTPDPTTPDPSTTTTTTDPTDPSGPVTMTLPTTITTDTTGSLCGEEPLPSTAPLTTASDNTGRPDLFSMLCAGSFGPDAVWVWTAPFDGLFRFDTIGSELDTVMSVFDGHCSDVALGCDDDTVQLWSQVDVKLTAGATVTIAVEGLGGQVGPIVLNVTPLDVPPPPPSACAPIDLGSQLGQFFADTHAGTSATHGQCVGGDAPELAFMWTPPFPGTFRVRTLDSNFDPVLYVRAGDCDGIEIGCDDDSDSLNPALDLFTSPSDGPLVIFVDGAGQTAGSFTLEIASL